MWEAIFTKDKDKENSINIIFNSTRTINNK